MLGLLAQGGATDGAVPLFERSKMLGSFAHRREPFQIAFVLAVEHAEALHELIE